MFAKQLLVDIKHNTHEEICDKLQTILVKSIDYNIQNGYQSNDLLIDNIKQALYLLIKQKHPSYNTTYHLNLVNNLSIENTDFVNIVVFLSIHYQIIYLSIILFSNITYYLPTLIKPSIIYKNMRFLINKLSTRKEILNKSNHDNRLLSKFVLKQYHFAYLQNRTYNVYL